jgi:4-diphosphocytidyl-2-C-methyl-D-erythritol kinase
VSDPLHRVTPVVRLAPAKVNLTLAVVGQRPDGFHALHSVMAPLDLADRLAISPAFGPDDRLHVVGPGGTPAPDLGPHQDNLALLAVQLARQVVRDAGDGRTLPALAVRLEKRIPVAAGLAGGSSDGAAAFDGALEAWGVADLVSGAARAAAMSALGSDCAFFLAGGWALVEGRGERVTPLPAPTAGAPGVVIVTPSVSVATRAAFARHAAGVRPPTGAALPSSTHLVAELRAGLSVGRLLERAGILSVANDLVPAASDLVPALVPARRALGRLLGRPVGQSGSGPTLWILAESRASAERDAASIAAALRDGRLALPGDRPPFITAATIVAGPAVRFAAAPPVIVSSSRNRQGGTP